MELGAAASTAVAILVVILLLAAFWWYNFTGWETFSFALGSTPAWTPARGADVSRLRFKNCTFAVKRRDGAFGSVNATPALNAMAVAYKKDPAGAKLARPITLKLARPLNPFSFVIPGFNDSGVVSDPSAPPWCAAACAAAPCAAACPGSIVSLVGRVRTI